ncbi:site-specific integrase [Streptomyces sp. NPDC056656]|uniref:site-specific integrase n=1 Tax=Streptomyces sp. NPDC056656 TaxID=3345895 RepID=UPI0036CBE758
MYAQSRVFRRYTAETKRNYATDIGLLLTSLWNRGKSWTEATAKDLEDYEDWRCRAKANGQRIGGSKWNRELAAFTGLYAWAARRGLTSRNPVAMRQVAGRNGRGAVAGRAESGGCPAEQCALADTADLATVDRCRVARPFPRRSSGARVGGQAGGPQRRLRTRSALVRVTADGARFAADVRGSPAAAGRRPLLPGHGRCAGDAVEEAAHVLRRLGRVGGR